MTDELQEAKEEANRAVEKMAVLLGEPFLDWTACVREGKVTVNELHAVTEDRSAKQPRSLPDKKLRAVTTS